MIRIWQVVVQFKQFLLVYVYAETITVVSVVLVVVGIGYQNNEFKTTKAPMSTMTTTEPSNLHASLHATTPRTSMQPSTKPNQTKPPSFVRIGILQCIHTAASSFE